MGATESKSNHRHHRSNKHIRYKIETSVIPNSQHKQTKHFERILSNEKNSLKRKSETIVPLVTSTPVNPNLQGSILNYQFPIQRAQSEIQINSHEPIYQEILRTSNRFQSISNDHSKGIYDYRKDMQRVDEENRPVLEGLCPDRMYVSTNDLHICDTQRLPPPIRCKIVQGFFRPIPPPKFNPKKSSSNASFL